MNCRKQQPTSDELPVAYPASSRSLVTPPAFGLQNAFFAPDHLLPTAMDAALRKAEALIEALNYIRTFRGCRTVVKLGGSAMEDPAALHATLQDVVFMETVGLRPVLVHGGGKPIDRAMAAAGLTPTSARRAAGSPTMPRSPWS